MLEKEGPETPLLDRSDAAVKELIRTGHTAFCAAGIVGEGRQYNGGVARNGSRNSHGHGHRLCRETF
jgi:hypothetical protein